MPHSIRLWAVTLSLCFPLQGLAEDAAQEEFKRRCIAGQALPELPSSTRIPLQGQGSWLELVTTTKGPTNSGPKALNGSIEFEDGRHLEIHAWLGQQISTYPVSGEDSQATTIPGPSGLQEPGQSWSIATGRPDTSLHALHLHTPLSRHEICVESVRIHNSMPPERITEDDWYTWVLAETSRPAPQTLPVSGPVTQAVRRSEDGHLRYADGERARFWGINLTGSSAIPSKEEAPQLAAKLAGLGFNAVRLHHIDGPQAGLLNPRRHLDGEPTFLEEKLDDLDFFVFQLKEHGVYLFLEVATQRELGPKDGLPQTGPLPNGHKLATVFRPRWTKAYLQAFEDLWGRHNPYTDMAYAADPVVALVELSNEHSLVANWGAGIEGLHRDHLQILDQLWNRWLQQRYASNAALQAAWRGSASRGGLQRGESLEEQSVRREPLHTGLRNSYPHKRLLDLNRFYFELEQEFYRAVAQKAAQLGFQQPIVASMSFGRPQLQHIYSDWDAADLHTEWDQTRRRRRLTHKSALLAPHSEELLRQTSFAVSDQAFLVTEVNHPFPNKHMAEGPFLWATLASRQDWDALIWFDWLPDVSEKRSGFVHSQFDLSHASVKTAQMPTASSMFRSGLIPPADGFFPIHQSPDSAVLQTIKGKAALPWELGNPDFVLSHQIRTMLSDHPSPSTPGEPMPELTWDNTIGLLAIDLPQIQVHVGSNAHDSSFLKTQLAGWAAVSLATTDGLPFGESSEALLTIGTRQENTGMTWSLNQQVIRSWGVSPILIEPAKGTVCIYWPKRPIVELLDERGEAYATASVRRARRGWWTITLDNSVQTPWLRIRDK